MKKEFTINLKLEGDTIFNDGKKVSFGCIIGLSVAIDTTNELLTGELVRAVKEEVSRVIESAVEKAEHSY